MEGAPAPPALLSYAYDKCQCMCVLLNSALKFDIGGATDAQEASALGYHDYHIDVYSNSWGPSDFGFVVRGPGPLVRNTLRTGVTEVCDLTNHATL